MLPDRKPSLATLIAVAIVLLYVGAYYATARPTLTTPTGKIAPWYHIASSPNENWKYFELANQVFAPMVWIDRRIRPHVWEPDSN
jgi:hypothetical protein